MISTDVNVLDPYGERAIVANGGTVRHYRKNVVIEFPEGTTRPNTYMDATRGRSIPQEFIACHVVPVVKKETPFQGTFAETLCYTMMLGEVVLPLVAS